MVYLTKIRGNLPCGYTNIHFMSSQPQHIQELLLPPVDVYWQSDQPVVAIHSDSRKVWWPNTVLSCWLISRTLEKGVILFMRFLHMATLTMQALVWIPTTCLNIICLYGCSVFFILPFFLHIWYWNESQFHFLIPYAKSGYVSFRVRLFNKWCIDEFVYECHYCTYNFF